MPARKVTKAMLETENKRLRRERNQARKELADCKARQKKASDSSISRSHSQLELTCSAMNLVTQWERDPKMEEKDKMIAELRAEIELKNAEIHNLRQGGGPVGEILARLPQLRMTEQQKQKMMGKPATVRDFLGFVAGVHTMLDAGFDPDL
jgi:hypothetical protein